MLRLEHIQKIYTTGEVLKDINWEIKPGDRIGLVGVNGAGKSTQLKIVAGEIEPTAGHVVKPAGLKVAYLAQEFALDLQRTVQAEMWQAFQEAAQAQQELAAIGEKLENLQEGQDYEPLLKQLDRCQRRFEACNGYELESRIAKMLPELGFAPTDSHRLVSEFSGGWQMRINLGKVMLQEPDILLLDEPTNHLDVEAIEWLEGYLKNQKIPLAIVSHDREFLDRLCTQIVETERGVSTTYLGNYSQYLEQKAALREAQGSAYERQQKYLAEQQEFVERFRAKASRSTQAKSREKMLEKIERIEAPDSDVRTLRFRFPPPSRTGRIVASVNQITHAYGENILFLGAKLEIERGDRIALVGPNGAGKSTLLRLLVGLETPLEGSIELGHNVLPGYFEQNQAEALDLHKTVFETLQSAFPDLTNQEIRTVLGQFLFSGDTVFKKVRDISGGEKARLALARLFLTPLNFLVLDEPTNHLDIPAKEMLEAALRGYEEGTVVLVSHDRYFISQVANRIVEVRDGELHAYDGDYAYYLTKKDEERREAEYRAAQAEKEAKAAARRAQERAKAKAKKATKNS